MVISTTSVTRLIVAITNWGIALIRVLLSERLQRLPDDRVPLFRELDDVVYSSLDLSEVFWVSEFMVESFRYGLRGCDKDKLWVPPYKSSFDWDVEFVSVEQSEKEGKWGVLPTKVVKYDGALSSVAVKPLKVSSRDPIRYSMLLNKFNTRSSLSNASMPV